MRRLLVSILLVMTVSPLIQAASGPDRMNYQGVLRDADGQPEDGTFDMRFRFFDDPAGGNELLLDEHLGAGTGGVVVTGGLFNVALGSGDVLDGSGPGVLGSLSEVFGGHGAVWLEIEIEGETLVPRVAVLSSPYALNASRLDGRSAGEFLDTSATPQEKTGLFTASGGIDFGAGATDDLDATDVSTLTGGGNADGLHTHTLVAGAADAGLLDGLDSSQFLRSDTSDTFTSGTLTLAGGTVLDVNGEIRLDGALYLDHDGPDGTQSILFHDGGAPAGESLSWSESLDRFTISNTFRIENGGHLEVTGKDIYMNGAGPDGTQSLWFYDGGEPLGESFSWVDTINRFWLSNTTQIAGDVHVDDDVTIGGPSLTIGAAGPDQIQKIGFWDNGLSGNEFLMWVDGLDHFRLSNDVYANGSLELQGGQVSLNTSGPDGDQSIRFYEDSGVGTEVLLWDDDQDRFELSDELATQGPIRTGSTGTASVVYNTMGSGTPTSGDMNSFSDLYVTADLEVGDQVFLGGTESLIYHDTASAFYFSDALWVGDGVTENVIVGGNRLYLGAGVPDGLPGGSILEYLSGTFTLYDDLDIIGTLSAINKNFVQNHPYDPSLEIVYTTLEGPEAATFTRGSARLTDGLARIALDESFAWVTHPDLGLTASLTPRGAWADLYVVSITTGELVVAAGPGAHPDAAFDYLVMGLRVGLEEAPVVRPRRHDAPLPERETLRQQIAARPDLARHTPLARYREIAESVLGEPAVDLSAGDALRAAIGTDPRVGAYTRDAASDEEATGEAIAVDTRDVRDDDPEADAAGVGVGAAVELDALAAVAAGGVAYEDDQGNLYARSFRPEAGGLDAMSPAVGDVRPGDVLALDPQGLGVRRADLAEDVAVVGIATGPAGTDAGGRTVVPFAVAGIVTCNVDASWGAIRPGDLLVSSPTAGHAMRLDGPRPGTVLGKALEPLDAGTGTIRVLVVLR